MNDDTRNFIAGSLAGCTARFLTQPIDVVKIRFQLQVEPVSKRPGSYYSGFFQAARRIFVEERVYGLWKGHIPAQLLSMTYCGTQFVTYYAMEKWLLKDSLTSTRSLSTDVQSGFVAAVVCSFACQPLDMIRTRLIAQGNEKVYHGLLDGFRSILRDEGLLAFWRGLGPSIVTYVPQITVYMTCYEQFKQFYKEKMIDQTEQPNVTTHFTPPWYFSLTAGGLSGLISKTVTYPLDLTKKRLEIRSFEQARTQFGSVPTPHTAKSYKTLSWTQFRTQFFASMTILNEIITKEGFQGLFKGWIPSAVKAITTTGMIFFWFEQYRWALAQF